MKALKELRSFLLLPKTWYYEYDTVASIISITYEISELYWLYEYTKKDEHKKHLSQINSKAQKSLIKLWEAWLLDFIKKYDDTFVKAWLLDALFSSSIKERLNIISEKIKKSEDFLKIEKSNKIKENDKTVFWKFKNIFLK